jgi:hypothetical protein
VVFEKLADRDLVDSLDREVGLHHPSRKVRDAGNVVVGSTRRVAALSQVLDKRINMRGERAAVQEVLGAETGVTARFMSSTRPPQGREAALTRAFSPSHRLNCA